MHYREAAANLLTNPALDPYAGIPEFKVCAVRVEPADGRVTGSAPDTEPEVHGVRPALAGD
jgi:predicted molibdopterin-dependent oxidoreductase YjgC